MPIEKIVKLLTFNQALVETELAAITPALQTYTVQWSGFVSADRYGRIEPFAEDTRVIARRNDVEDVADKGEIRFDTRNDLTGDELTDINRVLDDHDSGESGDTPDQEKARQNTADIAELRTLYDAGIADRAAELTAKLVLLDNGEDL